MNNRFTSDSWNNDGYVHLRQFLSSEDVDRVLSELQRFIEDIVPTLPSSEVFYEDKENPESLKQIQRLGEHDAFFKQLHETSPFRDLAEQLLNGPVAPKNLQYFNKPAGLGRATPPHQDGFYFMLTPCEAVTMWLALDVVDELNGCVRYIAGSHRSGLRLHTRTSTLGFSQGIADFPAAGELDRSRAMVARPGDLLAHDALTIHYADPNNDVSRDRRALGFIYYSQRAREDTTAHQQYQESLVQELAAQGKI